MQVIRDVTTMIARDSANAKLYAGRATLYQMLEDFDAAIEDLSWALAYSPEDPERWVLYKNRGRLRLQIGELQLALEDYTEARRLNPESGELCILTGIVRYQLNALTEACEDFRQALSLGAEEAKPLLAAVCGE